MTTETTGLTPRQRVVDMLCNDLNSQGWDQKNKVWFLQGEADDEWLEFVGEFSGAPEDRLMEMFVKNELKEGVTGVLVASEAWAYPDNLLATLKTQQALQAYWRLSPPSEHPGRVEIRHLLLACNDGEVIGLVKSHDADGTSKWAHMDASTPCPTGDQTIDAARGLLGLNDRLATQAKASVSSNPLQAIQQVADVLRLAASGDIDQDQAMLGVFNAMPEEIRMLMVADMEDTVKDVLRRVLPSDEHKKYGL